MKPSKNDLRERKWDAKREEKGLPNVKEAKIVIKIKNGRKIIFDEGIN